MLTNFGKFPTFISMRNGKNVFYRFGLAFAFLLNVKKCLYNIVSLKCNYTILMEISFSSNLLVAKFM